MTWSVVILTLIIGLGTSLLVGDGDLDDPALRSVFLNLRAWRLGNSVLAGAALSVAGVLVQGLFRNPLASPSILGTTAGASLGGLTTLLLWNTWLVTSLPTWLPAELLLPIGCLLGAIASLMLLLAIVGRQSSSVSILLTGFILSSLFLSLGGLWVSLAQEQFELGRAMVAFTLGGLEAKGARHFALACPMVLVAIVMSLGWGRHLDLLLAGEDEARSLGLDLKTVRRWVIAWAAMLTAAAVAVGGNVHFVGLIVPHALRPWIGAEHRRLVPCAAFGGAAFVVWADILTRCLPASTPIPLGIVTSLIGAPLFLFLLAKATREGRVS